MSPTADQFVGNPMGWNVEVSVDGNRTFTNIQSLTTRNKSVTVRRAGANEPATLQLPLWKQGGGFPTQPVVPDFSKLHLWDPYLNPSGLYVRYFNGFVLNQRPTIDGNANEGTVLECVGVDWLLDNPPARPQVTLTVGQAPQWLPNHTYAANQLVVSFPDCGQKYTCTTGGTSGPTQPAGFNGDPGGINIVDGTCVWGAFGDSAVKDKDVWAQLLPIYFPNGEITWDTSGLGNLKSLIAAVPSFQVTTDMTPRDVAKKLVAFASNRGYYATYSTWAGSGGAGATRVLGDLIEESPSLHGIIFQCTTPGVSGGSVPAFTSIVDLGSLVADGTAMWKAMRFTGRWEASITMTAGQRMEPQTGSLNGLYYQVTIGGISGATPPTTWPLTFGTLVTTGTVTLRCMGPTSVAPVVQLWTPSDNIAHNASWVPDFAWFDSNNPAQIATITASQYSDQNPQTNVHVHYSDITLNREGQNNFANRWYVSGRNQAFARVDDTTNQTALGMVVSRSYTDTSTTGPGTPTECADLGQGLLAVSIIRESVQVTAPDVTDPVMIQRLATCQITASLLGLGSQTYPATNVSVTLSNGAPKWEITFGSGFLSDRQDPYSNVRSSRRYGNDTTPPDLVTWPTGFVLGQSIDTQSHLVTATVGWTEDSADTDIFTGYYTINGDTGHWFPTIQYPTTSTTIVGLPRGATIQFYVAATDHNGNVLRYPGNPGPIHYSVSPTFVTPNLPAPPHYPLITGVTQGRDGLGHYTLNVTVNKNNPADDASQGGIVDIHTGDLDHVYYSILPGTVFPTTITSVGVGWPPGTVFHVEAQIIDVYHQPSVWTTPEFNYTLTNGAPHVPVITSVGQRHDLPNNYRILGTFTKFNNVGAGDDATGGARIYLKDTGTNDGWYFWLPGTQIYPVTAAFGDVLVGHTYGVEFEIYNQWGETSGQTGATNYTVVAGTPPRAPTIAYVSQYNIGELYYINVLVTPQVGDDASGSGWLTVSDPGHPIQHPTIEWPINSTFPLTVTGGPYGAGDVVTFTGIVVDHWGLQSVPSAPLVHTVLPTPPNAPSITGAVQGPNGQGTYYVDVTINKSNVGDDASSGGLVWGNLSGGGTRAHSIPPNSTFPITIRIVNFHQGDQVHFFGAILDRYQQWSAASAVFPSLGWYIIAPNPPSAPTITNPIAPGVHNAKGYTAKPVINVTPGDDVSGGGQIIWTPTTDGPAIPPPHGQVIPPGSAFPFTGFATGLAANVTYSFTAYVIDGYGQASAVSTPVTYRPLGKYPEGRPPLAGWAGGHEDQLLAGWMPVVPSADTDFAIVTDATGADTSTSLKMITLASAGGSRSLTSIPFSGKANTTYNVRWAARSDGGICTGKIVAQPQSWDGIEGDAAINVGSALPIGGVQSLSATYPTNWYEGTFTMPAGATQFVLVLVGTNNNVSGTQNLFWAYPQWKAVETSSSIGVGAVQDTNVASGISASKLTGLMRLDAAITVLMTNGAGVTVNAGDVVVPTALATATFTTTTIANANTSWIGVVQETIASLAQGRVAVFGYVPQVNLTSVADGGSYLSTSTTAKQGAVTNISSNPFAMAMDHSSSPPAILFGGLPWTTWMKGSNNLSELTNLVNARSALGLGGAAVLNVGTTAGTVAAGDDSRIINTGTSFPGSPTTNQRFYRTDLGVECYYDGTRWLGLTEYTLGSWVYYPLASVGEISATQEHMWTTLRGDYATRITRIGVDGYINGTNNGTNFWKFHLRTFTGLVDVQTTPLDSHLWAATTFTRLESTTVNTQPATSDMGLEWNIEKVGTPGPLRFSFNVYVRNVYT